MKGKILLKALEIVEKGIKNQTDFLEALILSGYGGNIGRELDRIKKARVRSDVKKEESEGQRRRAQIFISKMKRDGLLEKLEGGSVRITSKGKGKLIKLKNKMPERNYEKKLDNKLTIVSFDIPEKYRRKRDWLREVLRNLDLTMVHKSVWVGKAKIPQRLVNDLDALKIIEFVEIFEVSKTGTLERI